MFCECVHNSIYYFKTHKSAQLLLQNIVICVHTSHRSQSSHWRSLDASCSHNDQSHPPLPELRAETCSTYRLASCSTIFQHPENSAELPKGRNPNAALATSLWSLSRRRLHPLAAEADTADQPAEGAEADQDHPDQIWCSIFWTKARSRSSPLVTLSCQTYLSPSFWSHASLVCLVVIIGAFL